MLREILVTCKKKDLTACRVILTLQINQDVNSVHP